MKKVLLIFLILVSFYSNAQVREVYRGSSNTEIVNLCGFPVGTKYDTEKTKSCTNDGNSEYSWRWFRSDGGSIDVGYYNKVRGRDGSARSLSRISTCDAPKEINDETGICEERPPCQKGSKTGDRSWSYSKYGSNPTLCLSSCEYSLGGVSLCLTKGNSCTGNFTSSGKQCSIGGGNGLDSGGDHPTPPPDGCQWQGTGDKETLVCNGDADGDGEPDPDGTEDPDGECSWDGDTLTCNGGTYPDKETGGGDGDGGTGGGDGDGGTGGGDGDGGTGGGDDGVDPTVPEPDLDGVIKSIRDFNADNNANLNLINENQKIGFQAVVDANNEGFNRVVDGNKEGFDSVAAAVTGINIPDVDLSNIEGSLTGIENGVNSITGTDISSANFSDCYSSNSCTSLYETEYPEYENMTEMIDEKMADISSGVIKQVVDNFVNINISNAQKPDTNACFDFGFVDFGCFDFFKDFSWIWSFIRFVFIFTSVMTARKIVFGG
uniref:Uncharacterized protein n=1 Tax=Aliivibrio wodanis TaxID=80852 RepID=A0A5Q4Z4B0_9GAMM|nr:hypothetical protein AW0309160_01498 [Aliivibrio wodanis]VVV04125.1 hypothetical protein AW0309160_01508 [Aliivibrio wodanis]VVV04135.1 hypothetical protein AW0309160_01518 [Aliivibrio wodanis]